MTIQPNIKNKFKAYMFTALTITILCGCSGVANQIGTTGEKDTFVKVIINNEKIKDEKYGSKLTDTIEEVFRYSYEDVSVLSGYDSPKMGELVVVPQRITIRNVSHPKIGIIKVVDSTIKVSTNNSVHFPRINGHTERLG